jgi:hypothetical protein
LGAATVPTDVLQLPLEVVVTRAKVGAVKQGVENLLLKVVVSGHLAVTPEVLQLTVGERGEVGFHVFIILQTPRLERSSVSVSQLDGPG